ncbi:MAG: flagellar hook-associated protein FlgK [Pseudomonadota bacterium]
MVGSIYNIGLTALNAAQAGLVTTEHNIANANTANYSRQQNVQSANQPQFSGSGYFGQGVNIANVKRAYSDFLTKQVFQEQAMAAQYDAYYAQIQQVDSLLGDTNSGLLSAVQGFFNSVNGVGVASTPESQSARQSMISAGNALVSRFQSIGQTLTDINTSVERQISSSVATINSLATQLASLNQSIMSAQTAVNTQAPNDLLDKFDNLVAQLNQEIKATVVQQSDGSFGVYIGNGQPLVLGTQATQLTTVRGNADPTRMEVAISSNGAAVHIDQTSLQGGKLGGVIAFRTNTLDAAQNSLGQIAMVFADSFNKQHSMGMDLNGALGGNFFNVPTPTTTANLLNAGTGVVSTTLSNAATLTASDYKLTFNGGTSYTLLRLSDNTATNLPAGLPQTVDGLTFTLSAGTPTAGDSFLIRPTASGAGGITMAISDPNKVAAATPVRSGAALTNLGTGTISAATVNATPTTPNPAHPTTDLNLLQPITITFTSATTYNISTGVAPAALTPVVIGAAYTAGSTISYNGWSVQISGAPKTTDVFTVVPNSSAKTDGTNALKLSGLQTQTTVGGSLSYVGAYAQLVSQVGSKTNEIKVASDSQSAIVTQVTQAQQSVSGVNLDEEASNLMRYQRAYQAAGKAIQIANTLFDTILSLGR